MCLTSAHSSATVRPSLAPFWPTLAAKLFAVCSSNIKASYAPQQDFNHSGPPIQHFVDYMSSFLLLALNCTPVHHQPPGGLCQ